MPYAMMLAETTTTNTAIPEALETAFSWMVGNAGVMINIVTQNAVLCLGLAVWAAGASIGLFKRLV